MTNSLPSMRATSGRKQSDGSGYAALGKDDSACKRVFDTPEIVEMIFLSASMEDILLKLQRVCHWWQDVVTCSSAIQEYLFFKPVSRNLLHWHPESESPDACSLFVSSKSSNEYWADQDSPGVPRRVIENPHLYVLCGPMATEHPAFMRPEASWRRQLLTQPPLAKVDVCSEVACESSEVDGEVGLGVRMGEVAKRRELYGIRGWAWWEPSRGIEHLREVKKLARRAA